MDITNLSSEEIELLKNDFIQIFERLNREFLKRKGFYVAQLGGEPKITNLNVTLKGKLFIILKKLAKNVTLSSLTGISPVFLDNDLSELKRDAYQYCMNCDIRELTIRVLNDAIKGTEEAIRRLKSSDQQMEMIKSIDNYYHATIDKYLQTPSSHRDYTMMLATVLGLKSNIYSENQLHTILALSHRGYSVGMSYDFFEDIKDTYAKLDTKTNSLGR